MNTITRIKNKLQFFINTKHRLARVMSFEKYGTLKPNGFAYHVIKSSRKTSVSPVQFIGEINDKPFETSLPDIYWAELTDGIIIGGSSIVVSMDGVILYDMLANRKIYEANMTDNGLLMLGGTPKHIGEYFIYNYIDNEIKEIPTAISLACNMSDNYYHFMMEVASRFYTLSLSDIDNRVPLVIDERVLKIPQMNEVIDALNITNRPIINIKTYQRYKVNKLYILSEPHIVVPNSLSKGERRTENFAFDPEALDYISDTLSKSLQPCSDKYPNRIFLSRKGCKKRECNEDELEKVYNKFGFERLKTDSLSVAQQITLFRNAEHVMGSSGAAFTNLIFCRPGTKATIFSTGHRNITCFSSLGAAKGIDTYYATPENQANLHANYFELNPTLILSHLNHFYTE